MPRRNRPQHRAIDPDARFRNLYISMFINRMMRGGKKSVARSVMYNALALVEDRAHRDPVEVFEQALNNAAPAVEVKPKRVGGSTYQVPMEVDPARGRALAMRWLLAAARARSGHSMSEKLAGELLDAFGGQGAAIKRKDETHRMAEANRAFAHYRW
jgi:small subunit ribosomal protein S7